MHLIPDQISFLPILINFLECEYLLRLVIIQILINPDTLKDRLLTILLQRRIIINNLLTLSPGHIDQIPDTMTEVTILSIVDTKPTQIKSTDLGFCGFDIDGYFLLIVFRLHWRWWYLWVINKVLVKEYICSTFDHLYHKLLVIMFGFIDRIG